MDVYKLSFGTVILFPLDNMAEVVVDEDITLNYSVMDTLENFLSDQLGENFSLLINKRQRPLNGVNDMAQQTGVASVTALAYLSDSHSDAYTHLNLMDKHSPETQQFNNRKEALHWLSRHSQAMSKMLFTADSKQLL